MLAMAMALMRRPKMMLFDEPTGSLAPKKKDPVSNTLNILSDLIDGTSPNDESVGGDQDFGLRHLLILLSLRRKSGVPDAVAGLRQVKGVDESHR